MASVFGHGQAAPVSGAVKSVPSIRYRFSLVADPNDCERELVGVAGLTPEEKQDYIRLSNRQKRS